MCQHITYKIDNYCLNRLQFQVYRMILYSSVFLKPAIRWQYSDGNTSSCLFVCGNDHIH